MTDPQQERKPWQFQPGQSGNPGGRPKQQTLDSVLRELVDKAELARHLIRIATTKDNRDQQRAIEYIYNRLAGAPKQVVTVQADEDDPALLLVQQLWARLQPPVIDAEVRELPPGENISSAD